MASPKNTKRIQSKNLVRLQKFVITLRYSPQAYRSKFSSSKSASSYSSQYSSRHSSPFSMRSPGTLKQGFPNQAISELFEFSLNPTDPSLNKISEDNWSKNVNSVGQTLQDYIKLSKLLQLQKKLNNIKQKEKQKQEQRSTAASRTTPKKNEKKNSLRTNGSESQLSPLMGSDQKDIAV